MKRPLKSCSSALGQAQAEVGGDVLHVVGELRLQPGEDERDAALAAGQHRPRAEPDIPPAPPGGPRGHHLPGGGEPLRGRIGDPEPAAAAGLRRAVPGRCPGPGLRWSSAASSRATAAGSGRPAARSGRARGPRPRPGPPGGCRSVPAPGAGSGVCSTIRCTLMPPKPNALTAARRGPAWSHGRAVAIGMNRVRAISSRGRAAVQRRQQCPVGHRENRLDQRGDPGGGHRVTDHGFHRADHGRGVPRLRRPEGVRDRGQFRRVAGRRSRCRAPPASPPRPGRPGPARRTPRPAGPRAAARWSPG